MEIPMTKFLALISMIGLSALFTGCATDGSTVQTKQRAVQGGISGAIIGGVIGHQSGRGLEGAAVGAAAGSTAGAVYGSSEDEAKATTR
jgi:uncharacterized protein YcfJ